MNALRLRMGSKMLYNSVTTNVTFRRRLNLTHSSFLLFIVFACDLSVASNKCAGIFNSEVQSKQQEQFSSKRSKHSPSKIEPVFRLVHSDFFENTTDGLAYLNLANTTWKKPGDSDIKISKIAAKQSMPEAAVSFTVPARNSPITIEATETLSRFETGFNDRRRAFGDATYVRIRASSSDPNITHTLQIGDSNPYEIAFRAKIEATDIIIPLPKNDIEYDTGGFEKVSIAWKEQSAGFTLQLFGPVTFVRDVTVKDSYAREHVLNNKYFSRLRNANPNIVAQKAILKMAIDNLFNRANQKAALEIARHGEVAIANELNKIGIDRMVSLEEKVDTQAFFATIIASREGAIVPVEIGEFATEHGSYSHALQLIAMTRGMSPEQVSALIDGPYVGIFSRDTDSWRAWDSLFDAPGDSLPTSPLWWRRQLESVSTK